MKAIYYSLVITDERAKYQNQWIRSVTSLRRYNTSIPVSLFLYNTPDPFLLQKAEELGVTVHREGLYQEALRNAAGECGAILSCIPTLNKLLPLSRFDRGVSQLLFLDCDTFFFGDVNTLFEKYAQERWYAREEAHSKRSVFFRYRPQNQDEDALSRIAAETGARPVPAYNSGVVLLNHGLPADLFRVHKAFYRYAWRLTLGACKRPELAVPQPLRDRILNGDVPDSGAFSAIEFPSENFWILEQIALWLTLGLINDFSHAPLRMEDVLQNGEFTLYRAYASKCIVLHYFGGNEKLFVKDAQRSGLLPVY